jgi:hypothetical protein
VITSECIIRKFLVTLRSCPGCPGCPGSKPTLTYPPHPTSSIVFSKPPGHPGHPGHLHQKQKKNKKKTNKKINRQYSTVLHRGSKPRLQGLYRGYAIVSCSLFFFLSFFFFTVCSGATCFCWSGRYARVWVLTGPRRRVPPISPAKKKKQTKINPNSRNFQ